MRWWTVHYTKTYKNIRLCSTQFFYSTTERIVLRNTNIYYNRVCKKNIISNWSFCVNLITVDANFDTGARWTFSTDDQFLTVLCELFFIFTSINYTWFVMAEKERKLPNWGKLFQGKVAMFFEILSLFPYKIFSWLRLSLVENSSCSANTFSEDTLIYIVNL